MTSTTPNPSLTKPAGPGTLDRRPTPRHKATGQPGSRRREQLWAWAPVILCAAIAANWFTWGQHLASGDVGPFLRGSVDAEAGRLWNHQQTGMGSVSYVPFARFPEVLTLRAVTFLGGSDAVAMAVFWTAAVAWAAHGASRLTSAILGQAGPATAVAATLAVVNPYTLVALPNPLPTITLGCLGVVAAQLIWAARGRGRPMLTAAATLPLTYVVLNPPLIYVFAAGTVAAAAAAPHLAGVGRAGYRNVGRFALKAVPVAALLSLFWVIPAALTFFGQGTGTELAAVTDVTQWSFTHRRNQITNVLTFRNIWSWDKGEYHPFTRALDQWWWSPLAWALPVGAYAGTFLAPRPLRRTTRYLAGTLTALFVFSTGLWGPHAGVNQWLLRSVPGLWLLREPGHKLAPITLLLVAVGWTLTLDGTIRRVKAANATRDPKAPAALPTKIRALRVAVASGAVAAVAFPYPVWTGQMFSDGYDVTYDQHVTVPDGWYELGAAVNDDPLPGKVLVLPLDDYYQVPTTWGYYGVDLVARQVFDRPSIIRQPEAYFTDTGPAGELIDRIEQFAAVGDTRAVEALAGALGVSHIVVRDDLDLTGNTVRAPQMTDPGTLAATLDRADQIEQVEHFDGAGTLWRLPHSAGYLNSGRTLIDGRHLPDAALSSILATVEGAAILTDDAAVAAATEAGLTPVPAEWLRLEGTGAELTLEEGRRWVLLHQRLTAPTWIAEPAEGDDGSQQITVREATTISVDGQPLPTPPAVTLPADGDALLVTDTAGRRHLTTVNADGSGNGTQPVFAAADGSWVSSLGVDRLPVAGPTSSGDCRSDGQTLTERGIRFEIPAADQIVLQANSGSACVRYHIATDPGSDDSDAEGTDGDTFARIDTAGRPDTGSIVGARISFDYRSDGPRPARLCVWQDGPNRCAPINGIDPDSRSGHWEGNVLVEEGTTGLHLFLYADAVDGDALGAATVDYTNLQIDVLRATHSAQLQATSSFTGGPDGTTPGVVTTDGGQHRIEVDTRIPVPAVADDGRAPGDCNRYEDITLDEAGIEATRHDRGWELAARKHSACLFLPVTGGTAGGDVTLSLTAFSEGAAPAVCVWHPAQNRCRDLTVIGDPASNGGGRQDLTWRFTLPADGSPVELVLYAHASRTGLARVNYENVTFEAFSDAALVAVPATVVTGDDRTGGRDEDGVGDLPDLSVGTSGLVQTAVSAGPPRFITLAETYHPSWDLQAPDWVTGTHLQVNGWQNGWVLDEVPGDALITLRWTTQRVASAATFVSASTLAAVILVPLWRRWRARSR